MYSKSLVAVCCDANGDRNIAVRTSTSFLANDMAKFFSGKDSKLSGSLDKSCEICVIQFQRATRLLELINDLKVFFFHHLLSDHVMTFYNDETERQMKAFH